MFKSCYGESVMFNFIWGIHIDISSKTMKSFGFSGSWEKKKKKKKERNFSEGNNRNFIFFPYRWIKSHRCEKRVINQAVVKDLIPAVVKGEEHCLESISFRYGKLTEQSPENMLWHFIFNPQSYKEMKNEPCPRLLPQHPVAKIKCELGTRSLWSWIFLFFFFKLCNRPLVVTGIDRQKVICSGLGACQTESWSTFLPLQGHVEPFCIVHTGSLVSCLPPSSSLLISLFVGSI